MSTPNVLLEFADHDESHKENLPQSALNLLAKAAAFKALADKDARNMGKAHGEDQSADGTVWASADGRGWLLELDIEDAALDGSPEEVESVISDVLVTASGRGQAVGDVLRREMDEAAEAINAAHLPKTG